MDGDGSRWVGRWRRATPHRGTAHRRRREWTESELPEALDPPGGLEGLEPPHGRDVLTGEAVDVDAPGGPLPEPTRRSVAADSIGSCLPVALAPTAPTPPPQQPAAPQRQREGQAGQPPGQVVREREPQEGHLPSPGQRQVRVPGRDLHSDGPAQMTPSPPEPVSSLPAVMGVSSPPRTE